MAQSDLAPIDAEIASLERQLKAILEPPGNQLPEDADLAVKVRHDQWREQARQAMTVAVAVAQESAWPLRKAAAKHYARRKVLEELRDRQKDERRAKRAARALDDPHN